MLNKLHLCKVRILILIILLVFVSCNSGTGKKKKTPQKEIAPKELKQDKFHVHTSALSKSIIYKVDTFFHNRSWDNLSGAFLFSKGDKVYSNAFGKAGFLNGKDVKKEDVFQLASVSKFITSLCILRLVEDGKLKLTDTIENILPDFAYKNITIHHLLTHSSGLPEYIYFTDTGWSGDTDTKKNIDAYQVLNNCNEPAYFKPGERFNYKNSNYMLLAYISELKIGMPFSQVVAKYIKEPLGLDSLHVYDMENRKLGDYSIWGMRGDHSYIPDNPLNNINGDKGIYTNVFELFKIYKALRANKLINEKSKELLFTPHMQVKKVNPQFYGYGIRKTKLSNGETWYFHNGWWHGFRSYFWFNPDQDKSVILFTNRLKGGFLNTGEMIDLLKD